MPYKLIGIGILGTLLCYAVYQWGHSEGQSECEIAHAQDVVQALESAREQQALIDRVMAKRLSAAVESSQEATQRHEHAQSEIRRQERKYTELVKANGDRGDCGNGDELTHYLAELDVVLETAVCNSALPSKELPPVCDGTDLQATHAERASYSAALITYIEKEGLRANLFRDQ